MDRFQKETVCEIVEEYIREILGLKHIIVDALEEYGDPEFYAMAKDWALENVDIFVLHYDKEETDV